MSRDFANSKSARSTSSSAHAGGPSVLGSSLRVRGRLTGNGDLRIEGEIEGDVKVDGALELAEGGSVTGNVTATSVVLDGSLTGDVAAEGTVLIRANARVSGNMNGSEIALEEGASFNGRIEAVFELPDGLMTGGRALAEPAARRGR